MWIFYGWKQAKFTNSLKKPLENQTNTMERRQDQGRKQVQALKVLKPSKQQLTI